MAVFATITPTPAFTGTFFSAGFFMSFVNVDQSNGTTSADSYGSIGIIVENCTAVPSAPGASTSGVPYFLDWNFTADGGPFEIQEATASDFSNAIPITEPSLPFHEFQHSVTAATTFFYRVRPVTCGGSPGTFGPSAQVVVLPQLPPNSRDFDIVVPIDATAPVLQTVTFTGLTPNVAFSASTDKPYLTVTPSSGTVGSNGTVTVTVHATPANL